MIESDTASARAALARAKRADVLFTWAVYGSCAVFFLVVAGIFVQLLNGSNLALKPFGLSFLWTSQWNPVTSQFGALPLVYGTIVSSLIAIALAAGIGIFAAAFLADFAPKLLARPLSFVIELLAAVPSVVFGLWGLFVLAPLMRNSVDPFLQKTLGFAPIFQGPIFGTSLLTAGVILAIMIIPTVTAISRDIIDAVPTDLREGSAALGATRWETMRKVVLPAARTGIFGACILALGRALGETIAVTMVIGNKPALSTSLFAPAYSLPSVIANEFAEATTDVYLSALIELGLVLFLVSMLVNGLARVLTWTVLRQAAGGR
ncbi:MAG: phosphate ABC transporter permease subunit PstC [Candidatus Eremiobacteraeota bacterium]|nr:phosphate ABC transporter permease subunit PstC [Candidatus Eremiobacteraeota bacterium]